MAMCVRAMLLCSFIVAFVALVDVPEASAQEKYAGVALQPNGWIMRQMKTFSGSAPSRAWIFGRKKQGADGNVGPLPVLQRRVGREQAPALRLDNQSSLRRPPKMASSRTS